MTFNGVFQFKYTVDLSGLCRKIGHRVMINSRNNFTLRLIIVINAGCWKADCDVLIHDGAALRQTVVHSSMNVRKIKLIAYIYIHFSLSLDENLSRRSHLQANIEFTHSVCSNSGTATLTSCRLQRTITLVRAIVF